MKIHVLEEGKVLLTYQANSSVWIDFTKPGRIIFHSDQGGRVEFTRGEWDDFKKMKFVSSINRH